MNRELLVEGSDQPAIDVPVFFSGLPHRVLRGQTRSLVTFTPSMFEMLDELKVAAAHDVTVYITDND